MYIQWRSRTGKEFRTYCPDRRLFLARLRAGRMLGWEYRGTSPDPLFEDGFSFAPEPKAPVRSEIRESHDSPFWAMA